MSEVVDLNEARETRRMGELLSQLDEALRAEGIEPDTSLGRCFAMLRACLEHQDASQREFRSFLVMFVPDLNERLLRLIEDGQAVAERYHAAARDELAKVDCIADK